MKHAVIYRMLFLILLGMPLWMKAQEVREVPDSVTAAMQKQKEFAYANDPSYWKKEKPPDDSAMVKFFQFLGSPAMKVILYVILALVIIFIIYQVAVVNNFFVSSSRKKKKAEDGAGEEFMPDDIDARISEAISNREYRLAIRYLYLKTLAMLNEENKIKLHAKSTNYDYLNQMRQSPQFAEFSLLTRIYEYVWYGEFVPGQEQFEKIHNNFHQFISRN